MTHEINEMHCSNVIKSKIVTSKTVISIIISGWQDALERNLIYSTNRNNEIFGNK